MADFRYLPYPVPEPTLTTLITTTRSSSSSLSSSTIPSPTLINLLSPSSSPSIPIGIIPIPSSLLPEPPSITTITIFQPSSHTPTAAPLTPAKRPPVPGDITPTFYILAFVPVLVALLAAYATYRSHRDAASRTTPVDIELRDRAMKKYWWFEPDAVTDQVSEDSDDWGNAYKRWFPRSPTPLSTLWDPNCWPCGDRHRTRGGVPTWGRRHTFAQHRCYASALDPARRGHARRSRAVRFLEGLVRDGRLSATDAGEVLLRDDRVAVVRPHAETSDSSEWCSGADVSQMTNANTGTATATSSSSSSTAVEPTAAPSTPPMAPNNTSPGWDAGGIPSYYADGRSPQLNYELTSSSEDENANANAPPPHPGLSAKAAGKQPAKP